MQYNISENNLSIKIPLIARHLSLILLVIYLLLVPFMVIFTAPLVNSAREIIVEDIRALTEFTFGDWIAYHNEIVHEFDTLFRARCLLIYSIFFLG